MRMEKLGFGMMRLPLTNREDPASVDMEQVRAMVDRFLERGFTYFDTAYMYCGGRSEIVLREALVKRLQAAQSLEAEPERAPSPAVNYVAEAEKDLSQRLGRACHIAHGRKKGRVEIEYYGVDDLNNLLEALGRLGK